MELGLGPIHRPQKSLFYPASKINTTVSIIYNNLKTNGWNPSEILSNESYLILKYDLGKKEVKLKFIINYYSNNET